MRVAAVQYKAQPDDREASLQGLVGLTRVAAEDSDLVVLPEMAVTGYAFASREAVWAVSETQEGPTYQAFSPIARDRSAWIVVGYPERVGAALFNSALVIDPGGQLAFSYRKTLLYEEDVAWASPGDSGYRRFDTGKGSFGVGICMDLNDDRFIGWCAAEPVDVVALPTNWIEQGIHVDAYWRMRMLPTRAVLAAANSWGEQEHLRFSGASAILDRATLWAQAPKRGNAVIRASVPVGL